MHICVSHATSFDFRNDLYAVLKNSEIAKQHYLLFPHEKSGMLYDTKALFRRKGVDVVLAEVSYPSTGQGIELGWANLLGIRVVCVSKRDAKISTSLQVVTKEFIIYDNLSDMIEKLELFL